MKPADTGHGPSRADADRLLAATPLLDHTSSPVQHLVTERAWHQLNQMDRISAVYDYVRNEIPFGYNADDDLPASRVLADGYGQCNTKATLLMALLRAVGVPCRFHAATVDKRLQHGLLRSLAYWLAPDELRHSWVEVAIDGSWKRMEGVILDATYLEGLRSHLGQPEGEYIGYAVGTDVIERPRVDWVGDHTDIQMAGVERDLGVYDDPDTCYRAMGTNLSGLRRFLYHTVIRRTMNSLVAAIRSKATHCQASPACGPPHSTAE